MCDGETYGEKFSVSVGDVLQMTTKNKVSVRGTYILPLSENIGRIGLSATLTHTDSMITNYVDATSAIPSISALSTLPSLNLLNLNLFWNSIAGTHLDLALFGSNVT